MSGNPIELDSTQLFPSPFHRTYWRLATREFRSLRVLILAAMMTALRIAIKSFRIPIGPDLNITFGFLFNAVGSMIYGPVVAIAASAVSDTVGALLFPSGPYFFPYIFSEIAGGLLFALFYYRAKLSVLRIMLGRFSVTVVCNLILDRLFYLWQMYLVNGKVYTFMTWPRLAKVNISGVRESAKLTYVSSEDLVIQKKDILLLIALTLLSAAVVVLYYVFVYQPKAQ